MKKIVAVFALSILSITANAAVEKGKTINMVHCGATNDCWFNLNSPTSASVNPTCYLGLIAIGNITTTDKAVFQTRYSSILAAKMAGKKVDVDFSVSNGTCRLNHFSVY